MNLKKNKKTDYMYAKSNEDDIIAINVFYYIPFGITEYQKNSIESLKVVCTRPK